MKNKITGLGFFFLWYLVGGSVAGWTMNQFVMASMGGLSGPPAIWSFSCKLGVYGLPFLLVLGGAPAAIQMMRGRPWRKAAVIALAICATSWAVLMLIVIWGPPIWGWTW